ncbi:MAG: phosphoribosylamine--glycine ligase [Cryomorphaceae bacterium]|nr:phosphoribosylamine--glycine ligase [Flavobacteriales bacterium]
MNVLILGAGGREHALARKIAESPSCGHLYIAQGNAGTAKEGTNLQVNPEDFDAVAEAVRKHAVDLILVGPEAPLVKGIRDYFEALPEFDALRIIGPGKAGAQLEGSKDFAKAFMARHDIPTARYGTFTAAELKEAETFLETFEPPYVLKADGLAGGKGVLILDNLDEARRQLGLMLRDAKFGVASLKVVIEAFLDGIELSVFALTDGTDYVLLPEAKDYKRIGEGDTGLNTGGMGAVSPVPFSDAAFSEKVKQRIVEPTVRGLAAEGIPYFGFIFFGLIKVNGDPFVIEYNVRMGDPETEAVVPRISSDLLELLKAAADGKLSGKKIEFDPRHAATVMAVSGGYPESYGKGKKISGLNIPSDISVYHAGTAEKDGDTITAGGRVLAVTALGENLKQAVDDAYARMSTIEFEGLYVRRDIGGEFIG